MSKERVEPTRTVAEGELSKERGLADDRVAQQRGDVDRHGPATKKHDKPDAQVHKPHGGQPKVG